MAGNADYFRRLPRADDLPRTSVWVEVRIGLQLSLKPEYFSPACTGVNQEGEGMKNDLFSLTLIVRLALSLLPAHWLRAPRRRRRITLDRFRED